MNSARVAGFRAIIFLLPLLAADISASSMLIATSQKSARGPAYYRWVEFLLIATES
jgi:hypothetical protein